MEATVLKAKGIIQSPTMIVDGTVINNITGDPFWAEDFAQVSLRYREEIGDADIETFSRSHKVHIRVINGVLYNTAGTAPMYIEKTEIIDGKTVNYYYIDYWSGTVSETIDGVTKLFAYRTLQGTGERIDVINDNCDIIIHGSSENGYISPLRFGEDYYRYNNFDDTLWIEYHYGVLNTSIFQNNNKALKVALTGNKLFAKGTILDFVSCGGTIGRMDLYMQHGITGVMSEYLDALTNAGVKSHTFYVYIGQSGVLNDVFNDNQFNVSFDSNGNWTVAGV